MAKTGTRKTGARKTAARKTRARKAKTRTTRAPRATSGAGGKLYTLTELGKAAGVSMPTMQRYKKEYQDRIPSQGQGRRQRYPQAAVSVVQEIKQENMKRRGGARRPAASGGRPRAAAKGAGSGDYLPLTEIARRAGISYPTARKYAAKHGGSIPSRGSGRSRRYSVAAVETFKNLRAQSRRGRKPAAASRGARKTTTARRGGQPRTVTARDQVLSARVQQLEKAQKDISRQLQDIIDTLRRPLQVTISGS